MSSSVLGGVAGLVILALYVFWRASMFREIFQRSGRMIKHLRDTGSRAHHH
jgi:hypothetical protein